MALLDIFVGLFQILTLNVQLVGYEPDEETHRRMEQRAEMLKREMIRLWQEIEERSREQRNQAQRNQEQSGFAWASLLLSALQHWLCWAVAGVLVVLLVLCWCLRKWSREPEREEESFAKNVQKKKHEGDNDDANEAQEENDDANEPEENHDANEPEENHDANEDEEGNDDANEAQEENDDANEPEENHDANEDEEGNDDANEAQEENDDANEPEEENDDANEDEEENDDENENDDEEENDDENDDEEENEDEDGDGEENDENDDEDEAEEANDNANDLGRFLEEDIERPVQHLYRDCKSVMSLMETFIHLYQYIFSNTYFPVLEKAIEVGSAFEGWSPREEDITYRLILPLKPPRGHTFHLEPGSVWPMRNFRIRVDLVCTCEMEQPAGETHCFLHHPEQEHGRNAAFSILDDLCTASYLDVQKTAHYFQMFLRRSWRALHLSTTCRLMVLPSDRSCKFCVVRRRGKRILIELMFGVQEGDSDIFVCSQYTEAGYTPSTMWPETYAVAEMKFFRFIARKAHPDTSYLRCLQLCVRCLLGRDFSTYTLKTVMMHVLTAMPLSNWHRRYSWQWLNDILQYLQRCLQRKCLNHFFIGNENLPEEIILPLELRMAEPFNLFQHLTQNPYASEHANLEFDGLQSRVHGMLLDGR